MKYDSCTTYCEGPVNCDYLANWLPIWLSEHILTTGSVDVYLYVLHF